jgi:DNA modification methylase
MKKYDHPAMFPEALAERVLKLFSYKNDIILDPFNGAGTTTAVASN